MTEATALQPIVSALMMYIGATMHIPEVQIAPPEIRFISQSQIEAKACANEPCSVQGWFANENQTIYLSDMLDVHRNMHERSILLHEMVHYVQSKQNTPVLENECLTWKAREIQAYNIQYNWLYDNRVRVKTPTYNIALVGFQSLQCPD